ncbi:MAG: IS1380 family transposase, partial [Pyrinomonadaceae bacterium]
MGKRYDRAVAERKRTTARRLRRKHYGDQPSPVMDAANIHYDVSRKTHALNCGGIGAVHQMVQKIGLAGDLNNRLNLLKFHVPYHESDHVLNIAYNVMAGGMRLGDIGIRRGDEVFLNALGAERLPDATTAGDFTRRFSEADILELMEAVNDSRRRVWRMRGRGMLKEALIDVDGTIAPTCGERKGGMDISYNGVWGYHPLVVSLANTGEILYLVNRPGNCPSHQGAAEWIDRAIALVGEAAERICVRGDTDFSLTANFDRWSGEADFVFGMDAMPVLKNIAESLREGEWVPLGRTGARTPGRARRRPENVRDRIVAERGYRNIRLVSEDVAEFRYRPGKCERDYRMVVVRKNLSVERGESVLFDDIRYFFYITTREDLDAAGVVALAAGRCNQENVIEQLKNGVNAMR